jgi:hypothetical protein
MILYDKTIESKKKNSWMNIMFYIFIKGDPQ